MEGTYLLLMASARSSRQLRTLHSQLPENARLLRDDFVKLEEFWKRYLGNEAKRSSRRGNTPGVSWLIRSLASSESHFRFGKEQGYYERKLTQSQKCKGNQCLDIDRPSGWRRSIAEDRISAAEENFEAQVFGKQIPLGAAFTDDMTSVIVWFLIPDNCFTEDLAHDVLERIPPYELMRYFAGLCVVLRFPAVDELSPANMEQQQIGQGIFYYKALRGSKIIEAKLRDQGVPIESITTKGSTRI